jgi:hypothetical protein
LEVELAAMPSSGPRRRQEGTGRWKRERDELAVVLAQIEAY